MLNIATVISLIKQYGGADPAVIEAKVQDWLDAHPEATTTVQDGSITEQKLATSIAQKLGLVTQLSDEIDDIGSDVTDLKSAVTKTDNIINSAIAYQFDLDWKSGKYIIASNGNVGNATGYACTEEYYPVTAGQQLQVNLYANGYNECTVAFYNESKVFSDYITGTEETIITVPSDGYARFTTKTSKISTDDAYVKNYIVSETVTDNFTYFGIDRGVDICGETVNNAYCKTPVIRKEYKGNLNRQKRFLAIGFDDLRASDINMIMPLFEKYRARATFNKVYNNSEATQIEKYRTERIFMGEHELGDHTFLHYSFPYFDPLWNGQDPANPDGNQTPFPTNDDFRADAGDGKNVFGKTLTGNVNIGGVSGVTWANLTDAQCQTIRDHYSVMKNPTMGVLLDTLSNKYLGTSGTSAGSYDSNAGKYTGGIFTGCATSANHEVWERILELISRYNKEALNINWDMYTWSRPGSEVSNLRVTYEGASYYDPNHLYLESPQTRFVSSLTGEDRSWTDALLNCGYKVSHDYPVTANMNYYWVSRQMYFNAFLSKRDAIANMTNKTVNYTTLETAYPESFFTGTKSKAAQMYDVSNGQFRKFVEELRKNTANGLIGGEMIDSTDNYSFRVFFENALRYCQSAGIELITKAEAYNIAFENVISDGNLIGNENLRNTAQEFIKDSENMPTNPDGYVGNCSVTYDANGIPTLVTNGETYFIVFGAPYGKLKFTADVKGTGTIKFRGIKNNKEIAAGDYQHTLLSTITVDSASDFTAQENVFTVPMAPIESYEPYYEGYGNRICAVKIIYSAGLEVKNIRMVVN